MNIYILTKSFLRTLFSWFIIAAITATSLLGSIVPVHAEDTPTITEFTATGALFGITSGPDGNLWFTEYHGNKIGRITPEGVITEFPLPRSNSSPAGITVGPDNNIWFTQNSNDKIGRVNLSDKRNILNVPYFSQNTPPWGPSEYDHAQSLGFSNITMDRWGCAVTSAAMVLNYHNMNEFEDGTPINPGTLNNWLKNNNGYLTGKGIWSFCSCKRRLE